MRAAVVSLLGVVAAMSLTACTSGKSGGSAAEVLMPVPQDPTVTFEVWFDVGSQDDPPGKEGLAWLTGQMVAESSTTANPYPRILEKLYPLASSYGIRVDKSMTVISGRTHKDNVDAYLGLLSDAIARPAFDPADFERHKSDASNYLENTLRYQSDEELGKAALQQFVYDGTAYAHPPEGTVSGLRAITLEDVKAFWREHYARDRALPGIGGGYDDATLARFREALAALPAPASTAAAPAARGVAPAPFEGRHLLLVDKPGADASISFGFPIDVLRGEREFYALWIATSWLGEHRNSSSHLYQVIRETRGMNYGDYAYIEAFPEGGRRSHPPTHVARKPQMFEVWIRTLPNGQAHFAVRAAMRELDRLVEGGMSREDFELTRSFLKNYVLHFATDTATRLGYAVDDRFYGIGDGGHLARFREMMDALTLDDVNAAIRKHLQTRDVKIAIVTGEAAALASAFETDAPSPMTYASPKPPEVLAEDGEIASFPVPIPEASVRIVPVDAMFR